MLLALVVNDIFIRVVSIKHFMPTHRAGTTAAKPLLTTINAKHMVAWKMQHALPNNVLFVANCASNSVVSSSQPIDRCSIEHRLAKMV
jgi:hypothetical protein